MLDQANQWPRTNCCIIVYDTLIYYFAHLFHIDLFTSVVKSVAKKAITLGMEFVACVWLYSNVRLHGFFAKQIKVTR